MDILAPIILDALSKQLGQTVILENRGGAGGNIVFRASGIATAVVVIVTSLTVAQPASAALFSGNDLEIGWTGNTAFGPYIVNGAGTARGVYTAPMSGTYFSTSPYASSTDTRTWVADTNIRIHNATSFTTFAGEQWYQYLDLHDTLPDFRTLTFTLDTANTTFAGYDLATRLVVTENAFALSFGDVSPGKVVSIDVAVPEPASLGSILLAVGALAVGRRRN